MKARELCDEAIAGADSPLAKAFCNFVAEVVQQRLAYHSGEWVELRFDEQLFWLEPVVGQWERENETTVIVRTQPGIDLAWAQLRDTPRPPIELEMEIEYEPRRGAYDKFGVGLWPPEHVAEGRILYRFAIEYFSNQALIQLGDAMQRVPAELTERNRLKVQLADRLAVLWVNGKRCVEMRDPEFLPRGNYVFGTYSFLSSDRTFRISNVRYRKWVQDSTEEEPRAQ